ncbi:hypothetical protein [Aquirhabdus parva]|uniref:hypothetical protein n=1 Tax=Aquirhabdus parva TaxID=2283318 RepID=UPI0013B43044|nr:hypothetical protein [Aquirhabdus parva]
MQTTSKFNFDLLKIKECIGVKSYSVPRNITFDEFLGWIEIDHDNVSIVSEAVLTK